MSVCRRCDYNPCMCGAYDYPVEEEVCPHCDINPCICGKYEKERRQQDIEEPKEEKE